MNCKTCDQQQMQHGGGSSQGSCQGIGRGHYGGCSWHGAAHCFPILVFSAIQLEAAVAKFAGAASGCQLQRIQHAAVISSIFFGCQTQLRLRGGRGRRAETGQMLMHFAVLVAAVFAAADDVDLLPPLH
jgi:hypothetical protein